MKLFKPEMVFFDYGGTLFSDSHVTDDTAAHAIATICGVGDTVDADTLREIKVRWREMINFSHYTNPEQEFDCEFPVSSMLRCITDLTGLTPPSDMVEAEYGFHCHNATHTPMPYIEELLSTLSSKGIRTGVISNNALSGPGLELFLKNNISHRFEICVTSADYIYCKPCPLLFEAVCRRVGVDPKNCWYCGDNAHPDILGSHQAGMQGILVDPTADSPSSVKTYRNVEYLCVSSWKHLIEELNTL